MALLLKNISRITRQRLRTKLYAEYYKQKREAIPEKQHSAKEINRTGTAASADCPSAIYVSSDGLFTLALGDE